MKTNFNEQLKSNLFWGQELTPANIITQKTNQKIRQLVTFFAVIIAIIGWVCLILHLVIISPQQSSVNFLNQQSTFLIVFYLSTYADGYLFCSYLFKQAHPSKIVPLIKHAQKNPHRKTEISPAFTQSILNLIYDSLDENGHVTRLSLFKSIVQSKNFLPISQRLNLPPEKILTPVSHQITQAPPLPPSPIIEPELKVALETAFFQAAADHDYTVNLEHLLASLYHHTSIIQEILFSLEVDEDEFIGCLDWLVIDQTLAQKQASYHQSAKAKKIGNINASYTSTATPHLDSVSQDLTALGKKEQLPLCVGRDQELTTIIDTFASGGRGIILVGPGQVGKKTLISGLAQEMVEERIPPILQDKRLVQLDLTMLLEYSHHDFAQQFAHITHEIINASNIVLSLANIDSLLVTQNEGLNFDASQILAQAIEQNQLLLIATCQNQIYTQHFSHSLLGKIMTKIDINEPTEKATITMLQTKTYTLEKTHHLKFSYDSLKSAVNLSHRYLTDKALPQKAINVINLAAIKTSQRCLATKEQNCICSQEDIALTISELTKIPAPTISSTEKEMLTHLEDKIHQIIVGQKEAVSAISKALRRARTDLQQNQNQPLASLLFLGPTGVGKTALAKATADIYFGTQNDIIRLDMSEYQQVKDVEKMLGNTDGALGFLTESIKKQPYSLVLFDEIEKAHPDILNLFLQILDEGHLTSAQGEKVTFANTIIVATSNAGATYIQEAITQNATYEEIKDKLLNQLLSQHFRPEFINRFDEVIVFRPLSPPEIEEVVALTLKKTQASLNNKGITLTATPTAIARIAQENYHPQYGARPIQHYLKDTFESQIALMIVENQLARRDEVIITDNLTLEIKKAPPL